MTVLKYLGLALLTPFVVLYCAWAAAAVWTDGPPDRGFAGALVAALVLGYLAVFLIVRGYGRKLLVVTLVAAAVNAWWLRIPPSNDRDWLPDVARPARATYEGSKVTIENVRNFEYRTSDTDFVPHWETRTYDLDKLRGVDLFISFWGPTLYAHTIMSWEFEDSPPLAISIETRKEKGESYSAVLGFFRQYELYYVVADERDVIGVRDIHRGERTYLYRLAAPVENARRLLTDYLEEVTELADRPKWYNALTNNCTTTIRNRVMHAGGHMPLDWRLLANGYLDELMYERGSFDRSMPLAELRAKSEVTERAKAAGTSPDFWKQIRVSLPDYPR